MSDPAPDAVTPPTQAAGGEPAAPPPPPPRRGFANWYRWVLGVLAVLALVVVACETAGWPFLAKPLERMLAKATQREVRLGGTGTGGEAGGATRIHLLGGVRLTTSHLRIGAPEWSRQPYFIDAHDAELKLSYSALWRMRRGETLNVRSLDVARLDVRAERDAEGRSSWQFASADDKPKDDRKGGLPEFEHLHVGTGDVVYDDARLKLHLEGTVRTDEGAAVRHDAAASASVASAPASASAPARGLRVVFKGRYDKSPLDGRFESSGALALAARDGRAVPVRLVLDIGRASMRFAGTATDVLSLGGLTGVLKVSGPSLTAVGDPLRVTLPSTGAFSLDGRLRKDGELWNVVVDRAEVGSSSLRGAFQYDRRPEVPTLNGELRGQRVLLADLAPAIGGASPGKADAKAAGKAAAAPGRKLPQREFDIPALRAMDANVRIDLARLELGELFARPISPLHALLVLKSSVLTLDRIDAATADGRVRGMLRLDGRNRPARFEADLRVNGIDLARWLALPARKQAQPPYLTGRLDGQVKLKGAGNSTAALLGSADGSLRATIRNGTVSHLLVEAAGIDAAQALGILVKGDEPLAMSCAVADFAVKDGVLRPNAVLVDTRDSTITVDGTLSLAQETLDLRAVVSPKDMSPLTLRSPILVRGTFSQPRVSLDPAPVAGRVAGSVLLGLLHPLAALIPFIDLGEEKAETTSGCAAVAAKLRAGMRSPPAGGRQAPAASAQGSKGTKAATGEPPAARPGARP